MLFFPLAAKKMCTLDPLLKARGFAIDDFAATAELYFLTHAHRDHTVGLANKFTGTIYCTEITRDLLLQERPKLQCRFQVIRELKPFAILDGSVTAIQANHCDGSVMLLFTFEDVKILYTGDFRYDPEWRFLKCLRGLHKLYYDDTLHKLEVPNYPVYNDSVIAIEETIQEVRDSYGFGIPIFINSQILGIEMLLRKISRDMHEKFRISETIENTFRGVQLRYLLGDCIGEGTLILGNRKSDDLDGHQWIIPTSTHFLCQSGNPDFKDVPSNHHYIWFSTHADKREIDRLVKLCSPEMAIGCDFALKNLSCLQKK